MALHKKICELLNSGYQITIVPVSLFENDRKGVRVVVTWAKDGVRSQADKTLSGGESEQ